MSEQDDFEFGEFDRRLAPVLRDARVPPLVPRLGPDAGRRAAQEQPRQAVNPSLRSLLGSFIVRATVAWCLYSVAHLIWTVFIIKH